MEILKIFIHSLSFKISFGLISASKLRFLLKYRRCKNGHYFCHNLIYNPLSFSKRLFPGAERTPSTGQRCVLGAAPGRPVDVRERFAASSSETFQAAQARQGAAEIGIAGTGVGHAAAPALGIVTGHYDKPGRPDERSDGGEPAPSPRRPAPLGASRASPRDDFRRERLTRLLRAGSRVQLLPALAGSPTETRRDRRDPPRLREQPPADG